MAAQPVKTGVYRWEGTDLKGNPVSGETNAQSLAMIRVQLRRQGITAGKIQRHGTHKRRQGKPITALDISLFTRQLATLIKAGIPLLQALEVIAKGFERPAMRQMVTELAQDISAGTTLATAMRKQPAYFDALFCNLIDAGEQAGALDVVLQRVATYKEKTEALKKKVKKAMTYPTAVVLVALLVSGILLIEVVPQFQELFRSFDAQLPAYTLAVIALSQMLVQYGVWLFAGGCLGLLAFGHRYKRAPGLRQRIDRWLLKLPVIGTLLHLSAIARFARTLATLLAAGVPLLQSLRAVAGATGNHVYKEAVLRLQQQVATGSQIHVAMSATGVFPGMAIQMTAIGEESGTLDDMLNHVATYYESEVDSLVDNLTTLMEPLIMAVLGVLVGGLVIAMYLPIFKLGQVI
ncbi:type II secretion system F family protein [Pseudomonas sp. 7P_10.2_Bac1]|uniref:type II secretion system F family protein n=1 Tax=Pseudomonas sp. 7P_10.2_Bac1 TaxID=2971614 RepID=UPI0021CA062D|nr:type II secretion system F family protein [Pseudomonas sp. 7P_10.2_Bac1]MCU1727619.1 type II secretion system F family protein [Pseudomonas sp. 7P_10.2_Bac1]